MSRRARLRRDRRTVADPVSLAIANARAISAEHVAMQRDIMTTALGEFSRGVHCHQHWLSLADTANMAETLATMRLFGGADVLALVHEAQSALAAVMQRRQAGGSWTLRADELAALRTLVGIHTRQLEVTSYGEFAQAAAATAERVSQARAGNAPRNAVVIEGQLTRQSLREMTA